MLEIVQVDFVVQFGVKVLSRGTVGQEEDKDGADAADMCTT